MAGHYKDTNDFYTQLFSEDPSWSTPFPNVDEARRWAKICDFLSQIPEPEVYGVGQRLRILDVGCGRGWLTYLAKIYGECDGVDPSAGAIEQAQRYFPELRFYTGTVTDVLHSTDFKPYDVVITSEVIEHVTDKDGFITDLDKCLVPKGHIIITTPRGEKFRRYTHPLFTRTAPKLQPIEAWVSEKQLRLLFERHQFALVNNERAYVPIPRMSLLQLLCAVPYKMRMVSHMLDSLGLTWVYKGLQYLASIYQVWWFQKRPG